MYFTLFNISGRSYNPIFNEYGAYGQIWAFLYSFSLFRELKNKTKINSLRIIVTEIWTFVFTEIWGGGRLAPYLHEYNYFSEKIKYIVSPFE